MRFLVERFVPQTMQHNRQPIQNECKVYMSKKSLKKQGIFSNLSYCIYHMIRKIVLRQLRVTSIKIKFEFFCGLCHIN